MKNLARRVNLRSQRGSVLLFAVVMMFLMISFVNILVSTVASRSYFSRKVTTLNEYVNLAETTSKETVKEMRSFMMENVELVQYYFANGFCSSQTPGYNGDNDHHNRMLQNLMSTATGASYQTLMYKVYETSIKGRYDESDKSGVEEAYLNAAKCLFTYLTAARLEYSITSASDQGKTNTDLYIYPKFEAFLKRANDGYTENGETVTGLGSTYYDSTIYSVTFEGKFNGGNKVLTGSDLDGGKISSLAGQIGDTLGTMSFSTATVGNSVTRKTELGFAAYCQEVRATVKMPNFQVKELVQVNYDLLPVLSLTEVNSDSWIQFDTWSRYASNTAPTPKVTT